ncbi:hypothetical protein ELQ92_02220 [Labedella populi]|uniref:Trypsin-like serine protease n=1 Tax=Labedella populi TaxID=2498850 RepID=A0A444QEP7_9MICO|nr:hypothetical protein [Labedella populi]RWZ68087.1 hypothetical protein ELQ92_02220 [Labedella populi]
MNTFEWDSATSTLLVYSTEDPTALQAKLDEYLPAQRVSIVPAIHSKEEVDAAIGTLTSDGGKLESGVQIADILPAKDGSSLTVRIAAPTSRIDMSGLSDRLKQTTGLDVSVETAPEMQATAFRNVATFSTLISGAYMKDLETGYGCSTGYRIQNITTNQAAMLSADHCGRQNPGNEWNYSTVVGNGSSLGTMTSSVSQYDLGRWTGGSVGALYPAVFTGTNTSTTPITLVRGGSIPVVGHSLCFSGAYSGNVCNNNVTSTNNTTCFQEPAVCYWGTAYTTQTSGTPAAGQGDSGGPAYRLVDGLLHASGIISGIHGPVSPTCTGDAGGRLCSSQVIVQPVTPGTGWGLAYVP